MLVLIAFLILGDRSLKKSNIYHTSNIAKDSKFSISNILNTLVESINYSRVEVQFINIHDCPAIVASGSLGFVKSFAHPQITISSSASDIFIIFLFGSCSLPQILGTNGLVVVVKNSEISKTVQSSSYPISSARMHPEIPSAVDNPETQSNIN